MLRGADVSEKKEGGTGVSDIAHVYAQHTQQTEQAVGAKQHPQYTSVFASRKGDQRSQYVPASKVGMDFPRVAKIHKAHGYVACSSD